MSTIANTKPSTCCGRSKEGCICATEATCSCGKKPAGKCDCERAPAENEIKGPKCSCQKRPAGKCTCTRKEDENKTVSGETCPCSEKCPCGRKCQGKCTYPEGCGKAESSDTKSSRTMSPGIKSSDEGSHKTCRCCENCSCDKCQSLGLGSKVWPTPEVALETDFTGLVKL